MKMGRKLQLLPVLLLALFMLFVLSGCDSEDPTHEEGSYAVYYAGAESYSFATESRKVVGESIQEMAYQLLVEMTKPEQMGHSSLFPESGYVRRINLESGNLMNVYLTEKYSQLPIATEVMLRAGIVKTLIQLEGVDYVVFYVNEQPLLDATGKTVGIMSANSFLDSKGENLSNYEQVVFDIYYANPEGTGLVMTEREMTISGTFSRERQVVTALLEGPEDGSLLKTLPAGTSLISVSVKNNICYVNFSSAFLTGDLAVSPHVAIYSLVNSLTELSAISKVQIMVEGDSAKKFCETIPLDVAFERNLDYVVTGGK